MSSKTSKVGQLKYVDLLQQSQEDLQSEEIQYQANQAKLQLSSDILQTEQSLSNAKKEITEAKRAQPFDSLNVINAQIKEEALQKGLDALNALQEELF